MNNQKPQILYSEPVREIMGRPPTQYCQMGYCCPAAGFCTLYLLCMADQISRYNSCAGRDHYYKSACNPGKQDIGTYHFTGGKGKGESYCRTISCSDGDNSIHCLKLICFVKQLILSQDLNFSLTNRCHYSPDLVRFRFFMEFS